MDRIDLAHAPVTVLGRLTLHPAVRQIVRDDGTEDVVEPRVMQVLLALVRAEGGIVTRDQLTESCWEGRVVGEDAINRVVSRLRRVQEGIGAGSFQLETITKIGYRLITPGAAPGPRAVSPTGQGGWPRRHLIAGGAAVLAVAAGGGAVFWRHRNPPLPPQVPPLMTQGNLALRQTTPDGMATAVGLYRRVTELAPDYADGWAALAHAYAFSAITRPVRYRAAMEARSREAAARAIALDPRNVRARLALVHLLPRVGHYLEAEHALRSALADKPDDENVLSRLAVLMADVGRNREEAKIYDRLAAQTDPAPDLLYRHVIGLWSAGRLEDADRAMDYAFDIAPRQYAVWFTRFFLWLYTDRIEQAIGLGQNVEGRPNGIPEEEFDGLLQIAQAMLTRTPDAIDAAIRLCLDMAHHGAGRAENAMQHAAVLGRLDVAFAIADAYYFARGFATGDVRFSVQQGNYTRLEDRRPSILFLPSTVAMRRDARFAPLVAALGLERYWAGARVTPDYRT